MSEFSHVAKHNSFVKPVQGNQLTKGVIYVFKIVTINGITHDGQCNSY